MPLTEPRIALPRRYRVVRHIANGGMAAVWEAKDEVLGRLVAVKVLVPQFASDERASRRFTREARAAARLSDHPHVVTIFDIGHHDGRPFIVMEHFPGGTVADRLTDDAPILRSVALRWLRETASALDAAHAHDVVHRDVKPGNLLLDAVGRLAVGDFGVATIATETALTQTGEVLGTAAYLSPEQALGRQATAASDRYALAVVAYELLTGVRPFGGEHVAAQARQHIEVQPPRATMVAPELPGAVDAVLARGLAKDPARRPASAAALVDELASALDDGGNPTARTLPARPPLVPRGPRPHRRGSLTRSSPAPFLTDSPTVAARRRRIPPVLLVAVAALIAGIAVAALTSGDGTPRRAAAARHAAGGGPSRQTRPKPPPSAPTAGPAQLNDQGFALVQQGRPADAIPLLRSSVEGYRRAGDTSGLPYAYALYNLGLALLRAGNPADAVPYLTERLSISDNQRGVVEQTLAQAQAAAGLAVPPGHGKGRGHAKGPKGSTEGG